MNKVTINNQDFTVEELEALIQKAKKPRLTHPNGSQVYPPEKHTTYYYIDIDGTIGMTVWAMIPPDYLSLKMQNVFYKKSMAERYLDYLTIHKKLMTKIIQINADNNWVADWNDFTQRKYYLYWVPQTNHKDWALYRTKQTNEIYMCKQAKDYMMSDQVSNEDFKKFLLIYE